MPRAEDSPADDRSGLGVIGEDEAAELHRLAIDLVGEAGRLALDRRRAVADRWVGASSKSTPTDLVTEIDHEVERLIVDGIHRSRPDDAVLGEEGTAIAGTSGVVWSIDPIDGTTNFVYGLPTWCVSVAAVADDRSIAGAVFAPAIGELYDARRDHGARRNGRPIRCSAITTTETALVATGFGYEATARITAAHLLIGVIGRVRDIRRLGAAALDLCHVADGRVDAYYERGLNPWDIAAGRLIAEEAGAVVTAFDGGPPDPGEILASAPGIHRALTEILATAQTDR